MSKQYNGDGCYRKRADGRWEFKIMDGYLANGKANILSFYGRTKKEVRDKADEYKAKRTSGIDVSKKYTFCEWADIWFENHKENISPVTQVNYGYTLKALKEHFGLRRVDQIKAFDIEQFLKACRRNGRSDSYISQCRGMLYQIFNKAEANDLIIKNPVRFAEKMRSRDEVKRKEAFTAEEVHLLMTQLPFDRMGLSIRLMLGTGMRTQEILGLEPKHIEEDGSVIHIRQAAILVKGSVTIGPPKSRDSYRDIPVPPNLRVFAKRLRSVDTKFIWEAGIEGKPCNPSYFRKKFKEEISEIEGVRLLTPHSCRHTYVSQMQAIGVDLPTIQSIVGHADIDMTQHYLHVQDSIKQDAVKRFSEAFSC